MRVGGTRRRPDGEWKELSEKQEEMLGTHPSHPTAESHSQAPIRARDIRRMSVRAKSWERPEKFL